ncbi:MAG: hypothetical protein J6M54_04320 [Prevotella sp.]|nr:hypothetical protein [Prevotella sp.]
MEKVYECTNFLYCDNIIILLTLFSRRLRQEEDIIEYVKDYCLQEDGTDLMEINTAEYILIFGAFLPIMVITALIINTVPILSNRFLSFAIIVGIVIIYGWYIFKAENILKKNGAERYFEEFSEKPFKWQMKCMSFALLFFIFEAAAVFIFFYFIVPE